MSLLWGYLRQKSKEPTSVEKFAIALNLMAFAYFILAIAGHFSYISKVSPMWLIAGYFIMTVAELCLSPIGLSLVSKLAPAKFLSLTMGCWFLTSFFGNMIAGIWGGKYGLMSHTALFGVLAFIALLTGIILVCLIPKLNKTLQE